MTDILPEELAEARPQRNRRMLALGVLVSAPLLWLALRKVDAGELWSTLRSGDPLLLAATFCTMSISYVARGERWRLLIGRDVRVSTTFWGTCVGYLGNNLLPARAGELMRSVFVAKAARKPIGTTLAAALTERTADVVAMAIVASVAFTMVDADIAWLREGAVITGALATIGVLGVALANQFARLGKAIVLRVGLLRRRAAVLERTIDNFVAGMVPLHRFRIAAPFAGWCATIVLLDTVSVLITARAFDLTLSLGEGLLFLAAIAVASAIPSTPGYVGVYQFVAVTVLAPFGIGASEAVAYILGLQAVNILTVLIFGIFGIWVLKGQIQAAGGQSTPPVATPGRPAEDTAPAGANPAPHPER